MVRLKRMFSCSTTPIWRRSQATSTCAISTPSTRIWAALGPVKALDQLGQRRFAGARGPDDADDLTRRNLDIDVGKRFRPARRIAERKVSDGDGSLCRRQVGVFEFQAFRRGIEDVAKPLD